MKMVLWKLSWMAMAGALVAGSAAGQSKSSSASYELLHAPAGESGGQVSGGSITAEISVGGESSGPVSNFTVGGVQEKPNYIGQLYDLGSLAVSASPGTVDEGGTRQMAAVATMDDLTTLVVAAGDVSWSESSAHLIGVDGNGLVSAGSVYENTLANVGGSYLGVSDGDGFDLTVVNVGVDDYGSYAGDGIDDDWQVLYFNEPPNADAGPEVDPDRDGDDNLLEFLFGFDPTDGGDFFQLVILGKSGSTVDLELNKVIAGRIYEVKASPDMLAPFTTVGSSFSVGSEMADHVFQDPGAGGEKKFYRVEVSKP